MTVYAPRTEKFVCDVAVPPVVVTVTVPVETLDGTVEVIDVEVADVTVAVVPLILTAFPDVVGSKFVPVIVMLVPGVPSGGLNDVIAGVPSALLDDAPKRRAIKPVESFSFSGLMIEHAKLAIENSVTMQNS